MTGPNFPQAKIDNKFAKANSLSKAAGRIKNASNDLKKSLVKLITQASHSLGNNMRISDLTENFADGKVKGKSRPRTCKTCRCRKGSVTELRAKAKKALGEKAKCIHWCANMKSRRNESRRNITREMDDNIKKLINCSNPKSQSHSRKRKNEATNPICINT